MVGANRIDHVWYGIIQVMERVRMMNCPIFINCRDRVSCLSALVDWLEKAGYENIYLLDNDSSYPPLLEYYEQTPHTVIRLKENLGHTALWKRDILDRYCKPRDYYVYSDPDVVPVEECPPDALELFAELLERYHTFVKVGFGLRIDDLPDHYEFKEEVVLWERQFWQGLTQASLSLRLTRRFALYRGNTTYAIDCALRTGYPYLAPPWYLDSGNLSEEERYYRRHTPEGVTHWNAERLPDWLSQKITELRSPERRFDGEGDDAGLLLEAWKREPNVRDERTFTPWADPGWLSWNAMSPEVEFCDFAAQLVRMVKPEVVIETGVGQGYVTRRIVKQMHTAQQLVCYESDPVVRRGLRKLSFFTQTGARVSEVAFPSASDFARADFTILDSEFSGRFEELRCWWANAPFGAVALVHDCGNRHGNNTGHAALPALIEELGIPGVFLKNPRGSFLGVKSRHAATTSSDAVNRHPVREIADRETNLREELEKIKHSRSYRYTEPARWLRRRLGYLRALLGIRRP